MKIQREFGYPFGNAVLLKTSFNLISRSARTSSKFYKSEVGPIRYEALGLFFHADESVIRMLRNDEGYPNDNARMQYRAIYEGEIRTRLS